MQTQRNETESSWWNIDEIIIRRYAFFRSCGHLAYLVHVWEHFKTDEKKLYTKLERMLLEATFII